MVISFIRILSVTIGAIATGLLLVTPASAAPANDNFANAQVVGPNLPVSVPASNVDATAEAGEPAISGNAVISTVWFKWTAPSSQTVVVNLCGSGFTGSDYPFEKFAIRTSFAGAPVAEQAGDCSVRFNATASVIYYIQVDYGNNQGAFTFRMRKLTPPANDNFATPTTIGPALPAVVNATTIDSTWEAGEPAGLGGTTSSRSVWFAWTAPATGRVRLDVCQKTFVSGALNHFLGVYTGNTLGTIALATPSTDNCELDFGVTSGTTYRIALSGYIIGEFDFVLKLINAPPPSNDNFANAIAVGPGVPVSVAGDNDFATVETGEPDHTGTGFSPAHSVWFNWTPTQNSRVRIKTCSKAFEGSRVGVYTGAAVNALTQVAELPNFAPHCGVTLNAIAGTTYRIAAAGDPQDGAHGPFTLDIHVQNIPANDNFADAQVIGPILPATIAGTTLDATVESTEPSPDPYSGFRNPSVWYRWTAPSDDATIFSACSTGEPAVLGVFSGAVLGELEHIDGADKGCTSGEGGKLAIAPVAGQVYSIVVESTDRDFDTSFTLSAIGPKIPAVVKPPTTKPSTKFNLKKALRKCRKIKSKKKRANCIRLAKKKAAVIRCRKITNKTKQKKCLKKTRKKFRPSHRSTR